MEWDCTICRFFKRFTDLFIFFFTFGVEKKARLEFLHSTTKMAVRRLSVTRTPDMLKNLDLFIQAMRGRHYKKRVGVLVKVCCFKKCSIFKQNL